MSNNKLVSQAPARVIVIDVLKPHKPNILDLGKALCAHKTVKNANIIVYATDKKTESIKITLEGKDIDYGMVKKIIDSNGAVIHSLDKVVLGSKTLIEVPKIEK